jgi:hypothetical protein
MTLWPWAITLLLIAFVLCMAWIIIRDDFLSDQ